MNKDTSVLRFEATGLRSALANRGVSRKAAEQAIGLSGGYLTRCIQHERKASEWVIEALAILLDTPSSELFRPDEMSMELIEAFARGERRAIRGPDARLWSKIKITNGCWEWQGCIKPEDRSPQFNAGGNHGKPVRPYRLVYEQLIGPIPKGMEVCHTCDNRPCCRPDHLFLGTHAENMADMAAKGRATRWQAKLSDDDVREIRSRYGIENSIELAARYGISATAILHAIHRETYKHVA